MLPVNLLEGAFGRNKTFFWFVLVLIGFTVKFDAIGVTSSNSKPEFIMGHSIQA